jgi:hypothetical protein
MGVAYRLFLLGGQTLFAYSLLLVKLDGINIYELSLCCTDFVCTEDRFLKWRGWWWFLNGGAEKQVKFYALVVYSIVDSSTSEGKKESNGVGEGVEYYQYGYYYLPLEQKGLM